MADDNDTIVEVRTKELSSFGDSKELQLMARLEDGREVAVGPSWFTDEKSIDVQQFVGMTVTEARNKLCGIDQEYLKS